MSESSGLKISNIFLLILKGLKVISYKGLPIQVINSEITMCDVHVQENEGQILGAIVLWKSKVTFLGHTVFARNCGCDCPGVLDARSSTLIFQGNAEFVNNTGYDGGALALYAGSQIVIGRDAHLKFIGNHAKHFGGAIYVENTNYLVLSDIHSIMCFYQLLDPLSTSMNPRVVLENNTANYAGSALYGGWIDICQIEGVYTTHHDFNTLFQVNDWELDLSLIASNPLRVCLCIDSRPDCSITQYNTMAYPGTTIQLPAVAVGQRFGTVPSTVHSDFLYELMNGIHPKIQDWQHTQKVEKHCTTLTYTIMSPSQVELTMEVEVEHLDTVTAGERNLQKNARNSLYFNNLLINIEMLPCPLGFEYHNTSMMCT